MNGATLERNKQKVMAFYDLMFNQCKPAEAIDQYSQSSAYCGMSQCAYRNSNTGPESRRFPNGRNAFPR